MYLPSYVSQMGSTEQIVHVYASDPREVNALAHQKTSDHRYRLIFSQSNAASADPPNSHAHNHTPTDPGTKKITLNLLEALPGFEPGLQEYSRRVKILCTKPLYDSAVLPFPFGLSSTLPLVHRAEAHSLIS